MRLDHVGVATQDAVSLAEQYVSLFDADLVHEEAFQGMNVCFLDLGNAYLELLEPTGEETTIGRYLAENGPGMHHVAFVTDDIEDALANARAEGVSLVDEEPRAGAWGHTVAFLHPRDTGGVLVEYVEH
ncbi:methylmalonyl-CoA epimerase [Salarchaeum japonicum]|uniref:Methylmalonyl-CoA epimerase n=1 Tax=Salarchaeum japonicum TaxID=555573 RepID=A0AAV3T6B4_9EURY|nr:methylmalonyl-CoA epimerase [Salarchaeum japonicum]